MGPPNPSSTLRNLTTHTLPEDVIGLIAARFDHEVRCEACWLFIFNMTLMERCRTAMIQNQWAKSKLKGDCIPDWTTLEEETLQTCMMSPKLNQVAVCHVSYEWHDLSIIKEKERNIKENEDIIQA